MKVPFLIILETVNTGFDFGIIWESLIERNGQYTRLVVLPFNF